MKVLILVVLTINLYATTVKELVGNLNYLSRSQANIMTKTMRKGSEFNYGFTLTAIAWQESDFGKWKINLMDPSCGVFHIMPKYLTDNRWSQSRLCERLIYDYDFSFSTALQQLKYWENYWRSKRVPRVWSHTVASYNAGYNYNPNSKYLYNIKMKVRALKIYYRE